jgi:CheY-like chemotaxis protein
MNTHTAPRRSDPVMHGDRPRLMVVDDALESRQALTNYFVARGYEVSVATDGIQALAQSLTSAVDVVIMKATLPGLEGYEAAAILRKIAPRVQIILTMETGVEAHPREQQRTERFRCFPTPLNLAEIAGAVEGAWTGTAPDLCPGQAPGLECGAEDVG